MNQYQFSFEKLEVWQLAKELSVDIYKKTQSFPPEEKYSLTSQIRRSILAVSANIAEGSTRTTPKDQAKFTTIAFSSLMETFNHLVIACELGYVTQNEVQTFRHKIQHLSVKLSNLKRSQLRKLNNR